VSEESNEWALDELLGVEVVDLVQEGVGPVAFYGRCSTEDNQDPETSLGWQLGNARKFVEPFGGQVVAEYFDVGQSRSVPWDRRQAAARLLAELKDPERGWSAVVVGEGTRCWFGNQFSLIAPRFAARGVELWVPELGGRFDQRNPSHKMLMSVLGGMSESERQHVQARVRAAMDAQVINPNPRKSAEGYRLRLLAVDEPSAEVVRRIFAEYLDGTGDRAIAARLNRDGIVCPSGRRPDQNRHRLADGWQSGTVRAILENPRYTGYAVFGRWTKHETLLDPDDVSAGHVVRFRRSSGDTVVRSRRPAHPAIVSVETFTQVQLLRRSRAAGGNRGRAQLERTRTTGSRDYLLRGRVRCDLCKRRMEGATIRGGAYYRCLARSLVPGSPALAGHPRTVNLREDLIIGPVNEWIAGLFAPRQRDRTIAQLVDVQNGQAQEDIRVRQARERLANAEARIKRFQAAIGAGVDPLAVAEAINEAQAQRSAARAELDGAPIRRTVQEKDIITLVESLGDMTAVLNRADPEHQARLYEELRLGLRYHQPERLLTVSVAPRVVSAGVRGGLAH
jgi:DNA invertase Pin-like site-specific DNA recombinase